MDKSEISDKRTPKEFKGVTFSLFKRSAAKKELLKSLAKGNIEPACYWSAEYVCAGHFAELWETILLFASRNIHLGNPTLPAYLCLRYGHFKEVVTGGYLGNELAMRNSNKIRHLFAEIVCILSLSMKKHAYTTVKVKPEDFCSTELAGRLTAPDISRGGKVFQKGDPNELFIAINEFAYHISAASRNAAQACYWVEWLLAYESVCKREKKQKPRLCARREGMPVETKHQRDSIWIIWGAILHRAAEMRDRARQSIVKSLLSMFCIRYGPGVKRKRRYIIYFAIAVLTEVFDLQAKLYKDGPTIEAAKSKIDLIYAQIKKNEVKPKTDYLFNNSITGGKILEKTIEKLDKMGTMSGYIPRST